MEPKAQKKPSHPPFAALVCEALGTLDAADGEGIHGHSLAALKKAVGTAHQDLPAGWEHRLARTVKLMLTKKQLVHTPGHTGTFRLSKAMQLKLQHKRGPRQAKAAPAKKEAKPKKARAPKAKAAAAAPKKKKATAVKAAIAKKPKAAAAKPGAKRAKKA